MSSFIGIKNCEGWCVFCRKTTKTVCQRCGDFYCSLDCQRQDFQRHRYICFAIPPLVESSIFFDPALLDVQISDPRQNGTSYIHQLNGQSNASTKHGELIQLGTQLTKLLTNIDHTKQLDAGHNKQQQHMPGGGKQQQHMPAGGNQQQHMLAGGNQQQQKTKQRQQPHYNQQQEQHFDAIQPQNFNQQQQQPNYTQQHNIQRQQHNSQQQQKPHQNQQQQKQNQPQQHQNQQLHQYQNQQQQVPPKAAEFPKPNSRVIVTGFRSPNLCYVRELSTMNDCGFIQISKKINEYGETAPIMKRLPKLQSYAIIEMDGAMHRVQVLSQRGNAMVRVLLIDYGNTCYRKLQDIREINNEVLALPLFSVELKLKNVQNYAMKDEMQKFLVQHEQIEHRIEYAGEDGRYRVVELYNWQTNESLNNEIIEFGSKLGIFTKHETNSVGSNTNIANCDGAFNDTGKKQGAIKKQPNAKNQNEISKVENNDEVNKMEHDRIESPQSSTRDDMLKKFGTVLKKSPINQNQMEPVLVMPFDMKQFPSNCSSASTIVITDNSNLSNGVIGALALEDIDNLAELHNYLSKFNDPTPYAPVVDEFIIAKFENEWYRAKVLSTENKDNVSGGKIYTVYYMDFANDSIVTKDEIRRYPPNLTLDCRTSLCLIDGLPNQLNKKQVKYLENVLQMHSRVVINGFKVDEDAFTRIYCKNLLDAMEKLN